MEAVFESHDLFVELTGAAAGWMALSIISAVESLLFFGALAAAICEPPAERRRRGVEYSGLEKSVKKSGKQTGERGSATRLWKTVEKSGSSAFWSRLSELPW